MRCLIAAVVLASPAFAQVPPKYPVAAFAALPFIENVDMSPDGTAVAAKVVVEGQQRLAVIDLSTTPQKVAVTAIGKGDLLWFEWANNARVIASLAVTDKFQGQNIRLTRLISFARGGGPVVKLDWQDAAQIGDNIVWMPPNGGPDILLATSTTIFSNFDGFWPRVDRVNVETGKARTILKGRLPIRDWYADEAGTVRVGWGYNGERNAASLIYRPNDETQFKVIARASYRRDEQLLAPVRFLADPNKLIVRSDHAGRVGIYDYDLTTGTFGKALFAHAKYDVSGSIWWPGSEVLAGVRIVDDRRRTEWLDPEFKALQADLDKALPGQFAEIVSTSADRSRMIVRTESPTVPPSYWIMDQGTGRMSRFGNSNSSLKGAKLAEMKPVGYAARDGLEIPAYLTLPVGRAPKNLPLILLPHGGPYYRDALTYDYWVQFLANRGYAVLQPNYRGSTGYGTDFQDKGDGQWGLAMQDDLTDGVRWLVSQGIADPKRVCIVGGSYGGYAALRGVAKDPDVYRCAIAVAGVSDLAAQVRYDRNFLFGPKIRGDLQKAAPDFSAVSPALGGSAIKAPVLLIHGKLDLTVPFDQSERMEKALLAAGKSVEFVRQPLGDHGLSRQADRIEALTRMEAFLAKYNPAD